MPEPIYKVQRNKSTGAVRDLVSHDNGATWQIDAANHEELPPADPIVAEQMDRVDGGRNLAARDPELFGTGSTPKIIEVTEADGGPIQIEGDVPQQQKMSPLEALGRGGADTASFGFSDESAGAGAALRELAEVAGSKLGLSAAPYERTAGRGVDAPLSSRSGYAVNRDAWRGEDAQALADQEGAFRGGQVGAALLTAAAPLGSAARGGALLQRVAGLAKGGAIAGGLSGAGNSRANLADDPRGLARDTAAGAATGAVVAPVAGEAVRAVVHPLAKLAARGAEGLRGSANANRLAASGTYGAQLRDIASNRGPQAINELGEDIERLGIHKGEGMLGFLPQPPATYERNSARIMQDAGRRMGAAEDAIAEVADPLVTTSGTIGDLYGEASKVAGRADPAAPAHSNFLRNSADRLKDASMSVSGPGTTGDEAWMPFSRALEERRYLDDTIDWTRKGGGDEAPRAEQVRRWVAGDLRSGIRDTLDTAAADPNSAVTPELADAWKSGNRDFATAATVHDPSMARVYQEYGNQKISLPAWMAAAGGTARGGPVGGGVAAALAQLAKSRGTPALAGAQRFGQRQLEGIAKGAEPAAANAAAIGQARDLAPDAMPLVQSMTQAPAYAAQPEPDYTQSQGHELEGKVRTALEQDPQAFGRHSAGLLNAMQSGDPDRFTAELYKASANQDFRTRYLPSLQQGAR
jgi:hypothetical protein